MLRRCCKPSAEPGHNLQFSFRLSHGSVHLDPNRAVVWSAIRVSMDLHETIRQLKIEKEKIERAILQLEQLQGDHFPSGAGLVLPKRRGRKAMGPEERREVSERMKKYWDAKRRSKSPEQE